MLGTFELELPVIVELLVLGMTELELLDGGEVLILDITGFELLVVSVELLNKGEELLDEG